MASATGRHRPGKGQREAPEEFFPPTGSGGGMPSDGSQTDSAARILTLNIKQVKSATELLDLLGGVVDDPIFNYFHASAACSNLAERMQTFTPSEKGSSVLPRLAARYR